MQYLIISAVPNSDINKYVHVFLNSILANQDFDDGSQMTKAIFNSAHNALLTKPPASRYEHKLNHTDIKRQIGKSF